MVKILFTFTKEIADLLSSIREKSGLSQSEIAKRIGLSFVGDKPQCYFWKVA